MNWFLCQQERLSCPSWSCISLLGKQYQTTNSCSSQYLSIRTIRTYGDVQVSLLCMRMCCMMTKSVNSYRKLTECTWLIQFINNRHEHHEMLCRPGCKCEQQYRMHRLLAFDPSNECRGIFSDWFELPSFCVCKLAW